jgi:hypothetical protein
MSHNLYTINNEGGNVLSYHGFNDGVIYIGRGEDAGTYAGSFATGAKVEWYDSNPINTIEGASFTKRAGTNWIQEIHLPAGTYLFEGTFLTPMTGLNEMRLLQYIFDNSTESRPTADPLFLQNLSTNGDQKGTDFFPKSLNSALLVITPTSPATTVDIYWKFQQSTGMSYFDTASMRISETQFLFIRKIA